MNILINIIGIVDSGGVSVFRKLMDELPREGNKYYIVCTKTDNLASLVYMYNKFENFVFVLAPKKNLLRRFVYENYFFRKIIVQNKIDLVYNFSGSIQFTHDCPQLVKLQNLLFFSKRLDSVYWRKKQQLPWFKQVFLKRLVLKQMLRNAKYIEVQSDHVKDLLSDFVSLENKVVFIKSDIDVSNDVFSAPKQYDFSKKIKFLYIVGPHFGNLHKNLHDFTSAMLSLIETNIDFEINITLTSEQLNNSKVWHASLNSKTNFLGYISSQEKMTELFCDNTILISTSIIETLGLHVVEGIKNGVITIAPNEGYTNVVYGENLFKYELFDNDALLALIQKVIGTNTLYSDYILTLQHDLKISEKGKIHNIMDIFKEVLNV